MTLTLFAIIVLYHTYLDVTGIINVPTGISVYMFSESQDTLVNQKNILIHAFEIYIFITFSKFIIMGALTFLCYYNREFINSIIMWLVGSFIVIIESCIRILSDRTEHVSLIFTLNFIGLMVGYLMMYLLIKIVYNLVTDVSLSKG
ncbi:hypothetical protein [Haloplasma contractile]|uniref:hypothetical protein n=1 Tax=Haloplasma contractile TaxID=471825 RepID=UPI000212113C|nr:hypothetical protein [Haloplasma contractile]